MYDIIRSLLVLAVPAGIGALVAWRGWWGDPATLTKALNRFAVDVAFPMLIISGIAGVGGDLPRSPWFWLAVPVVDAVAIATILATGSRRARGRRATASLVAIFPNSAYLGLPLVVGVYGIDVRPAASAWVAIQVGLAVAVGPAMLAWSTRPDEPDGQSALRALAGDLPLLLRRPLVLAPLIGLAARGVGGGVSNAVTDISEPIGRAASPVALFVLGIYCVVHAADVGAVRRAAAGHSLWRMAAVPALALAFALAMTATSQWSTELAAVFVALFSMPAGITTFSLTFDAVEASETGRDDATVVAATIVVTSIVALVSIPATVAVVDALLVAST